MSADGSRVYWTTTKDGPGTLFLRVNIGQPQSNVSGGVCTEPAKACTVPVSETVSTDPAHFWSASPDGSKALFTIEDDNLGSSSPLNGNLYEFDLASGTSSLIAKGLPIFPHGAVSASEDGSRIVFPSKEVLTGPNAEGKSPVAGGRNLYFFDSAKAGADRFRFIGSLSTTDFGVVISPTAQETGKRTSRITLDGLHFAFFSTASLTGYDNTDANSGEKDAEIFIYDVAANGGDGQLTCVSCNPSGQRPEGRLLEVEGLTAGIWGAALLPPAETELYSSRIISDSGDRIFFDSYEALIPTDTNGKADVYQWETLGTGDCSQASPDYSSLNAGCISLISSGESPSDSEFVDASPDGRDVFFTTDASLLPQDPGLIDIYDARAGGGYPPPPTLAAACEGEACQGPPAPPNDPTPASAAFNGAGNAKQVGKKQRHHKKAQHKKKSAKKKQSKKKNAKRSGRAANNNRRAVR